jgi:hypothetical protein
VEALIGIGPKDALSQANKLSRTYAVLLEALNRHVARVSKRSLSEQVHVHDRMSAQ